MATPEQTEAKLEALAASLGHRLLQADSTVTTAESCTGGLVAKAITDIAGSSAWFEQGWVTYSNQAKQQLLHVDATILEQSGAVSEQVVLAMADQARHLAGATAAVALSGVAGPGGGTDEKPVGTVWIAWSTEKSHSAERFLFDGNRQQIRIQAAEIALQGLIDRV